MKKEMIKAVRMVNGFSADLRVKLPYRHDDYTPQDAKIRDFLLDHLLDIYGSGIYDALGIEHNPQPGADADDYRALLAFVGKESRAVLLGEAED